MKHTVFDHDPETGEGFARPATQAERDEPQPMMRIAPEEVSEVLMLPVAYIIQRAKDDPAMARIFGRSLVNRSPRLKGLAIGLMFFSFVDGSFYFAESGTVVYNPANPADVIRVP